MFPCFCCCLVQYRADFFQLGHIDGIRILGPGGHTGDLPGQLRSAAQATAAPVATQVEEVSVEACLVEGS